MSVLSGWWSSPTPEKANEDDKPGNEEGTPTGSADETGGQVLYDASSKAYSAAKGVGGYLMQFSKTVANTAMNVKSTIEEKTLIGEFSREQSKFIDEQNEKRQRSDAALPPWVGYAEEAEMKEQILNLSEDKRNFLRNPPPGVQYEFDFEACFPVAIATLQEDANLQKMRFELVPKQMKEENFWRNYFYRVSLIKQSAQLSSLASKPSENSSSSHQDPGINADASSVSSTNPQSGDQVVSHPLPLAGSPPADHEFVSDSFQGHSLNEEEVRNEMQQLNVKNQSSDTVPDSNMPVEDDLSQWEQELQQELQDFEVVGDGDDNHAGDAELETEILKQIEEETRSEKKLQET